MRCARFKRIVNQSFLIIAAVWLIIGCVSRQRPPAPLAHPQSSPPAPAAAPERMPEGSPKLPELKENSAKLPELKGDSSKNPVPKKVDFHVHIVRWAGETLSVIAQWYTGSHKNVTVIAKANSGFDPKRMKIGDQILIPMGILKTREPMPREYLEKSAPKKNVTSQTKLATKSANTKIKQTAEFNKIELFELQDTDESAPESDKIELFEPVE